MAEPVISDLALRGVGSCAYEPEAQRSRFPILNERNEMKPGTKLRIILLDDNEVIRSVLSEILVHRGYEVFTFSDPSICPLQITPECRCNANQTCTDIIISDLDMPNMTGLGFIENQKKKKCKCQHVVLMSGGWTDHDLQRAHELGCKTFAKPFHFDEFFEWLDEVERSIESTRELRGWFQESGPYPRGDEHCLSIQCS